MGIALDRFYLYPPDRPGSPHVLVRTLRPAGPNAAQPAVDFADDLADAKANALYRAWRRTRGAGGSPPEPLGSASSHLDESCVEDRPLLAHHGHEVELWWTSSTRRPSFLQIGPGVDEAAFWSWLGESLSDRRLADLSRPAAKIRARLLTEAELRFVDAPLLLVEDVDWLTAEEFDDLHRGGGLERLLAGIEPRLAQISKAEVNAVKLSLVERALADDLRRCDRRAAAFRASELARFDANAAGELIERLCRELTASDDRRGIAWALAYALHGLLAWPGRSSLLSRLGERGGSFVELLMGKLAEIEVELEED